MHIGSRAASVRRGRYRASTRPSRHLRGGMLQRGHLIFADQQRRLSLVNNKRPAQPLKRARRTARPRRHRAVSHHPVKRHRSFAGQQRYQHVVQRFEHLDVAARGDYQRGQVRDQPAKSMSRTFLSRTRTMRPSPITRWQIRSLTAQRSEPSPAIPLSTPWVALSARHRHSVRGCRPPPDTDSVSRSRRRVHRGAWHPDRFRRAVSTRSPPSGTAVRGRASTTKRLAGVRGIPGPRHSCPFHAASKRSSGGMSLAQGKATYARRPSICTGAGSPNQGRHVPGGRGVMPPEVGASYLTTRGIMPPDQGRHAPGSRGVMPPEPSYEPSLNRQ
ncbi:hypothetical protein ThimaDRAFT_4468 [Thiocapsa marina 5811]|uniref:Uncharacterized protein n=1 Tax=Thiocapsa marina 5811 TaxID=768671 RepID=F9UHR5_9GAMM|nr:hypothetical protein ThimaDRAFT_4468 [Thiocapsa marina 5811]